MPRAQQLFGLLSVLCLLSVLGLLFLGEDSVTSAALVTVDEEVTASLDRVPRLDSGRVSLASPVAPKDPVAPQLIDERPMAEAASDGPLIRFTVVDESKAPLLGASVTVLADGLPKEYLTNDLGVVELPSRVVANALVSATAPGFNVEYAHPGSKPADAYRFTLLPGASIRGRLVMADKEPVPEGARVCAFLQAQVDLDDRNLPRMARLGRGCSSEVGPDGTFCVKGLEDGAVYQVSAYGGGVIANEIKGLRTLIAPVEGLVVQGHYVGAVTLELDHRTPERARFLAAHRRQLPDLNLQRPPGPEFTFSVDLGEGSGVNHGGRISLRLAELCKQQRQTGSGLPDRLFVASETRAGAAIEGTFQWDLPFTDPTVTEFKTALATQESRDPGGRPYDAGLPC